MTMPAAASWKRLADRAASEQHPRKQAALQLVLTHLESEVGGDLDTTMETLNDHPVYLVWGATDHTGPQGRAAVRAMYDQQQLIGKNRLEFDIERVMVDEDAVVTEGVFRHAYVGSQLMADGIAAAGEVDPDERYLIDYRALIVWVMDEDGRIAREDTYKAHPARVVRRLDRDELPHLGLPSRRPEEREQ